MRTLTQQQVSQVETLKLACVAADTLVKMLVSLGRDIDMTITRLDAARGGDVSRCTCG